MAEQIAGEVLEAVETRSAPEFMPDWEIRFWDKVLVGDDCWEWTGATAGEGYGYLTIDGQNRYAHHVAYESINGPIPEGHVLRHVVCDNPPCVRPSHLLPGTQARNVADAVEKGRNARGARNGAAKLDAARVAEIRARYATGTVSQRALATEFGVSASQVCHIVKGQQWT